MGNKLGVHVTTGNRDGYGTVAPHSRIVVSKLADAGLEIGDNTFFIYRPGEDVGIYTYNGQNNNNIMPGFNDLTLADMVPQAEYWWPRILAAVIAEESRLGIVVDAIQPINEAEGDDPDVIAKLVAYETRLMELANQSGRKLAFASYAPNSPHIDLWKQHSVQFIKKGWELGHIYSRHVYLDFVPIDDNRTRIFDEINHFKSLGIEVGPIALTEWGFINYPGNTNFMNAFTEWDTLIAPYEEIGGLAAFTYGDWNNYAAQIAPASPQMSAYLQSNPATKWNPFESVPPSTEWQDAIIELPGGVGLVDKLNELEGRMAALEGTTPPPPEPEPEPIPLPLGHNYPLGVDVSRYQYENTNWTALKNASVSFAFIRLGSAYTLKDANFDWNWQNAGINNILRGAYWYLYPENIMSISAQVNHVAASVPSSCELPLVLDVEQAGLTSVMVKSFLELFGMQAGYKPIIYTGAWYWVPNMGAAQVWATAHDLWVANYTLGTGNIPSSTFIPLLPDVWSQWKFWQWTSSGGSLVGQSFVPLDLNYFNGTPEQLYQYSANFISSKQPAVQKVNVLDFIRGTHQKQFDLDYGTGTQTTQIWHIDDWNWLYIKGNGEYERLGVRNFNGEPFIYRFEDTSESVDRWYAHFKDSTLSEIGAPWCPVLMEVDKPYTTGKFVQHFLKSDCAKQNGGNVSDTIKLISNPYQRTYPKYNKTETVITLEWTNGGEFYDFAGGNIGFRDTTRDFQFMGWLEGRADKAYKKPTCFNVGW